MAADDQTPRIHAEPQADADGDTVDEIDALVCVLHNHIGTPERDQTPELDAEARAAADRLGEIAEAATAMLEDEECANNELREENERLREALRDAMGALTYTCSDCDQYATWRAGKVWFYCDGHIEEARALDRRDRSKGSPGETFVEVENVAAVRRVIAALGGNDAGT